MLDCVDLIQNGTITVSTFPDVANVSPNLVCVARAKVLYRSGVTDAAVLCMLVRPDWMSVELLEEIKQKFTKPASLVVQMCAGLLSVFKALLFQQRH